MKRESRRPEEKGAQNDPACRIDAWLWHARVVRTRAEATALVRAGYVRLNGRRVEAAGKPVRPGDVLTVALSGRVRVLRVLALALRRGSSDEAALLSEDIAS